MLDPLPAPAPWLMNLTHPFSQLFSFSTLPLHAHELIASFLFYQCIQTIVSPLISSYLFPTIYPSLNRRTKINWDVHVVSLVQSCSINAAALWVMYVDEERKGMNALERVYGYTGACGMIQGLAAGYFLWDLVVTSRNIGIFGVGMWAHAICALCVFYFGFRPFLNFYGPTFILYELSSPFLNIHWFLDKLHLTGSKYQWYNGIVLLATFFGCRLVWGTYQSIRVYQDVWAALHLPVDEAGYLLVESLSGNVTGQHIFVPRDGGLCLGKAECLAAQSQVLSFVGSGAKGVPIWLAITYLSSNTILNSLNFYWFGKMIETVRKRFEKKPEGGDHKTEGKDGNGGVEGRPGNMRRRRTSIILDAADCLEIDEQMSLMMDGAVDTDGKIRLDVEPEQKRVLEAALEQRGKATALDGDGATPGNGTRRR